MSGSLALLADAADAEVALRRRRLTAALAEFDAATIATTHQFCQLVLRSLGVAGDTDSASAPATTEAPGYPTSMAATTTTAPSDEIPTPASVPRARPSWT